jgi:hypothetical protein
MMMKIINKKAKMAELWVVLAFCARKQARGKRTLENESFQFQIWLFAPLRKQSKTLNRT